jgi:hypothetical protein
MIYARAGNRRDSEIVLVGAIPKEHAKSLEADT